MSPTTAQLVAAVLEPAQLVAVVLALPELQALIRTALSPEFLRAVLVLSALVTVRQEPRAFVHSVHFVERVLLAAVRFVQPVELTLV